MIGGRRGAEVAEQWGRGHSPAPRGAGGEGRAMQCGEVAVRHCLICGKALVRRILPGGRSERRKHWMRRKYCGRACCGVAQRGTKYTPAKMSRRHSTKLRNAQCVLCGRNGVRLYAHHINKNPLDNDPHNIGTFCGSCHTKCHSKNYDRITGRAWPCVLCGYPAYARGFCRLHYDRSIRRQNLMLPRPNAGRMEKICVP